MCVKGGGASCDPHCMTRVKYYIKGCIRCISVEYYGCINEIDESKCV